MDQLVRISASYFTAGVVVRDERVVRAAPILKYMLGWPRTRVLSYARAKGWKTG